MPVPVKRKLISSCQAVVFCAIALLCSPVVLAADAKSQNSPASAPVLPWTKLVYSFPMLVFSLNAEIELKSLKTGDLKTELLKVPGHKGQEPKSAHAFSMTMTSDNFGRKSVVELLLDPDFSALQRTQLDTGKRNRQKVYRYLTDGVWTMRKSPKEKEEDLGLDQWTDVSTDFHPFPAKFANKVITDNSALFYLIPALKLRKAGDTYEIISFHKNSLSHLVLSVEGRDEIEVNYIIENNGQSYIWEDEREVIRVLLKSKPVIEDEQESSFELLGLKGDIYLYLDPETGLLLRLSGNVDFFGLVDIGLSRARLQ